MTFPGFARAASGRGRIIAVGLVVALAAGCSKESPAAQPPPAEQRTQPAAGTSGVVTGKVVNASPGSRAIVVLESTAGEFPVPTEPMVMDQQGLTFTPGLLLVRQGQPVMFRNSEDVLHNVRVGETGTAQPVFNVATIPGNSYTYKFDRPGFYSVGCDVHETMHADIFVTPAPYAMVADESGMFTFSGVRAGSYTLAMYSGGQRVERPVDVRGSRVEVSIGGQ
jgi:plastocyanin